MLEKELGIKAEIVVGARGQFAVVVDGATVIEKSGLAFPEEPAIVEAVKAKL